MRSTLISILPSNIMVQVAGGYYLTRDQVREYAKRENVNLQAVVNQPDIFNLLAIERSIERKGFQDVKVIGIWYPRGSLRKFDAQEPTDAFLLVTRWRTDYRDIALLSDVEPFEENDHDRAVKAQMASLGITDTKFITVPDPDHEFSEMGGYVSDDNDDDEQDGSNAVSSDVIHAKAQMAALRITDNEVDEKGEDEEELDENEARSSDIQD
ncbi:hypothetical protein CPB84DRAFT_1828561 [Gymnopilus junonius]|uniref:Uncharacterized protein n=1 Tax=Gymnopilus junonius TaxID=109634 RepID=A0A9P5NC34_GYMJU|nr:hypothetical protein CPB84DRAFT_1828561 [Gymnopilus junonius]